MSSDLQVNIDSRPAGKLLREDGEFIFSYDETDRDDYISLNPLVQYIDQISTS